MYRTLRRPAIVTCIAALAALAASASYAGESATAQLCAKCATTTTLTTQVSTSTPRTPWARPITRTVARHGCDDCANVATRLDTSGRFVKPVDFVHQCGTCGPAMSACATMSK